MASATKELMRLLGKACVTPYRRFGRVRIVYDPRTPAPTLTAAADAVKKFAPVMVDVWGEPDLAKFNEWKTAGLKPRDICDDPMPKDVDPMTVAVGWLLARCRDRYHCRFFLGIDGQLMFGPTDPATDAAFAKTMLPAWFAEACQRRREEIIEALRA